MEGSVVDAPDSWEVADLDANFTRLVLGDSNSATKESSASSSAFVRGSSCSSSNGAEKVSISMDVINQVDQFLLEALQNPRERLSVLRLEQAIEKFIHDPSRQQLEFSDLPTSYLRLAAHRLAQHYSLQSMVLADSNLLDGSGSRIIICKTSERMRPLIRLADIPVDLPTEVSNVVKVAIKQRPQKQLQTLNNSNSNSSKKNNSKSVEERKDDYNRARARIFNSSNFSGVATGRLEFETKTQDTSQHGSSGVSVLEGGRSASGIPNVNHGRGTMESATSSRSTKSWSENEPASRHRQNNRVAIFRDREVERNDPDYDRNYDRYMQRFDPGFGFSGGSYTMQPMCTPAVNYNTEFPHLGATHRPHISTEQQPRQFAQHFSGPWTSVPSPVGISYCQPETTMASFNPNHIGSRATSAIYLHPSQYPGLPFIHPQEHFQHFSQSNQHQPDGNFGIARPR